MALGCALAVVLGGGCRPRVPIPKAAPLPTAPTPPPGVEGLVVFVAENTAGQLAVAEEPAPDPAKARLLEELDEDLAKSVGPPLRQALEQRLNAAGLKATTDPWSGADLVATATAALRPELAWDEGGIGVSSQTLLVLSTRHGKEIARVEVGVPASDEGVTGGPEPLEARLKAHAVRVAAEAVKAALGSPQLASFLDGRRSRKSIAALLKQEEERQASGGAAEVMRKETTDLKAAQEAGSAFLAGAAQAGAHALVVGIERYQDLSTTSGARSDAIRFAALLLKTAGIPEANLRLVLDDQARKDNLQKQLEWLAEAAEQGGRVYLFISGGKVPDPRTGAPLLLPFDRDPSSLPAGALKLENVLKGLSESKARDALVVLDSCSVTKGKTRELKAPARVAVLETPAGGCAQGELSLQLTEGVGTAKADADGDRNLGLDEVYSYVSKRMGREGGDAPPLSLGKGVTSATFTLAELEKKDGR
jgi:hypothetical protein